MVERLQLDGHEVDRANSFQSAVDAFTRNQYGYDAVITDIDLRGPEDGEDLASMLIALREKRGYDVAPEIICITGARSKMNSALMNRLRDRGCRYALKGSDQYLIETEAAMTHLKNIRGDGPTFLFVHRGSDNYAWGDTLSWGCNVGETVDQVLLLHPGGRKEIELGPAPRRLFDFLAKHTSRRPLTVEEVANGYALDEFYSYWQSHDKTVSSDSVKNNVLRIRAALDIAFGAIGWFLRGENVLATEKYEDKSEPSLLADLRVDSKTRIRVADIDTLIPHSATIERYRLKARAYVEHIP